MRRSVTVRECKHPKYTHRVRYPGPEGATLSAYFSSKTKALKFAKEQEKETGELGRAFGSLSAAEGRAVSYWRELCRENSDTPPPEMLEVLREFGTRWKADRASITVEHAVAMFLETKTAEGMSPTHLQSLKARCERFADDFTGRKLTTIRTTEISKWVLKLRTKRTGGEASPTTKRNHRLAVSNLFSFAKSEGWVDVNPVAEARNPKKPKFTPRILTPSETKRFLHALEEIAPEILPFWAVRIFGGLRKAEAEKLDWRMVDLERGVMNLPGRITKTERPRQVAVQPALKAFLAPLAQESGPVFGLTEAGFRTRMKHTKAKLPKAIELHDNFARHGYGTYHALHFRHAGETAAQMGHNGDPEILFAHYTAESNARSARAFWAIRPKKFVTVQDGRRSA